jgi:hypothetical protein
MHYGKEREMSLLYVVHIMIVPYWENLTYVCVKLNKFSPNVPLNNIKILQKKIFDQAIIGEIRFFRLVWD